MRFLVLITDAHDLTEFAVMGYMDNSNTEMIVLICLAFSSVPGDQLSSCHGILARYVPLRRQVPGDIVLCQTFQTIYNTSPHLKSQYKDGTFKWNVLLDYEASTLNH